MRGVDGTIGSLFSDVDLEERIPARHPLRKIRHVVTDAQVSLDAGFAALHADCGRPSMAPERLVRAPLFRVRAERQRMGQMQHNLMFRWFIGPGRDDPVGADRVHEEPQSAADHRHRRQGNGGDLAHCEGAPLLSDAHFSVDGTLVKAWAPMKSFRPKPDAASFESGDGPPPPSTDAEAEAPAEPSSNPETAPMTPARPRPQCRADFRDQTRSNATPASGPDLQARLYKTSPGTGARLCVIGHALRTATA